MRTLSVPYPYGTKNTPQGYELNLYPFCTPPQGTHTLQKSIRTYRKGTEEVQKGYRKVSVPLFFGYFWVFLYLALPS
jgi:hypothetical protein